MLPRDRGKNLWRIARRTLGLLPKERWNRRTALSNHYSFLPLGFNLLLGDSFPFLNFAEVLAHYIVVKAWHCGSLPLQRDSATPSDILHWLFYRFIPLDVPHYPLHHYPRGYIPTGIVATLARFIAEYRAGTAIQIPPCHYIGQALPPSQKTRIGVCSQPDAHHWYASP